MHILSGQELLLIDLRTATETAHCINHGCQKSMPGFGATEFFIGTSAHTLSHAPSQRSDARGGQGRLTTASNTVGTWSEQGCWTKCPPAALGIINKGRFFLQGVYIGNLTLQCPSLAGLEVATGDRGYINASDRY